MTRAKIDYGVDLGTTNSAIARMENGEVKIIKSDLQKDTTPSCVYFRKNTVMVGDNAYTRYGHEHIEAFKMYSLSGNIFNDFNTFIEFKRTMGSNKLYESKSACRSYNSEELSAEVLKALRNHVLDDQISSVVVTVPARFRNNQIDATQKAAELAGFKYCELLMEPIAASIAYGVSAQNVNGYWLVFDFGGGTFDAALMRVEEGIMKVVDTDGDMNLGGKDLDYAIVDKIIIPFLRDNYKIEKILSNEFGKHSLRESLKVFAEAAKIAISHPSKTSIDIYTNEPLGEDGEGKSIDFELRLTLEEYENAVSPIFQRAIDISKKMIDKNNLQPTDLQMVLLVGGPTLSQTLRKMLKEQLDTKIDTSIDPMTSVAVGAALFASSKDVPMNFQKRDKQKVQVILKYPNNTVETDEDLGIRIDRIQTNNEIPIKIFCEIIRKDKGWSSGKVEIIGDAEIISLSLVIGKSNGFEVKLYDEKGNIYPCEPASFNIIQGFTQPSATLPYDLGIEIVDVETTKNPLDVFQGLRKNESLPAKGKGVYKTQKDIRPGNTQDRIRIPVWEGEAGTRAIFNFPAGYILITGEDLPKFLPKDSEVVITLEVDISRSIRFKAFFPDIDETIEKRIERKDQMEYSADELDIEIEKSKTALTKLEGDNTNVDVTQTEKLGSELQELKYILDNGRSDYNTKTKVMERLRLALKELDNLEVAGAFPKAEGELLDALESLDITNQRYGNVQTTKTYEQFQLLASDAIKNKNMKAAKELISQIRAFDFTLVDQASGVAMDISFIKGFDDGFEKHNWKNMVQARQLINQAKQIIAANPTRQKLRPIILELFKLLPDAERPKLSEKDDEFLTR